MIKRIRIKIGIYKRLLFWKIYPIYHWIIKSRRWRFHKKWKAYPDPEGSFASEHYE